MDMCVYFTQTCHTQYLEQGMVSSTPPHCQILKLISRFSPEIFTFECHDLGEMVIVGDD